MGARAVRITGLQRVLQVGKELIPNDQQEALQGCHTTASMEPGQITAAVMSIVNTSHIILQYVQNQNLQKQARRRRQRGDESDEDMDTDFSQSLACLLTIPDGDEQLMVTDILSMKHIFVGGDVSTSQRASSRCTMRVQEWAKQSVTKGPTQIHGHEKCVTDREIWSPPDEIWSFVRFYPILYRFQGSWADGEQRLLARCPALKAGPHQQPCRKGKRCRTPSPLFRQGCCCVFLVCHTEYQSVAAYLHCCSYST
ncbi:hypothetical protein UY3_00207 [Chelonia mydas]|uniref:Uncharacterized protein n=1 Tax=Chelonia mydas TaxID=8469 RepID=M7CCS4_CHEMY|nr:hypothetical protein UY3_00207 [Chelonia mydas]